MFEGLPPFAGLELTYKCNHNCPFCSNPWKDETTDYPGKNNEKIFSGSEWIKVIDKLSSMGVREFCISGGEPAAHPDFPQIIQHMCNRFEDVVYYISDTEVRTKPKPLKFSLLTNGDTDIFTEGFCQSLKDHVSSISIGLMGDDELYRKKIKGRRSRTLATIRNAAAAGLFVVQNITLYPGNIHCAPETVQEAIDLGVRHVLVMRPLPVGAARAKMELIPEIEEFKSGLKSIRDVCKNRDIALSMGTIMPKCAFPSEEYNDIPMSFGCGCGNNGFCVDPWGNIRPCSCSTIIGGSVKDPLAALNGPKYQGFLEKVHPGICNGCRHMDICSGGCPAGWYYSKEQETNLDAYMPKR